MPRFALPTLFLPTLFLLIGCGATFVTPAITIYDSSPPPRHIYVQQPAPAVVAEIEAPSGHAWVYYPESNCYVETTRNVYVVEREGRWVTVARPVPVRGPKVVVEHNGPRPWIYVEAHRARHRGHRIVVPEHAHPAGYTWVYYPGNDIYYCTSRRFHYRRRGGVWVRGDGPPRVAGTSVRIDYNGPQPFLYVGVHQRRHLR